MLACHNTDYQSISLIIASVYAPIVNHNENLNFYNKHFDLISELATNYNCNNTLVMGDFYLILDELEAKNRIFTA